MWATGRRSPYTHEPAYDGFTGENGAEEMAVSGQPSLKVRWEAYGPVLIHQNRTRGMTV